jgi:uncharacterized protein (TIGR02145 family)
MAQNLNYKTGNSWCYDDNSSNCQKYGRLYDWSTAKNACPSGWHLPSDGEWQQLERQLGMSSSEAQKGDAWRGTDQGSQLKDQSFGGTNSSGFSALPGGYRLSAGSFYNVGDNGYWWSATANGSSLAWGRILTRGIARVVRDDNGQTYGFSVRCLQD